MTEPSFTLPELRQAALDEADSIAAVQGALVLAGLRTEPHAGELVRRDRFLAMARLADMVRGHPETFAAFRRAVKQQQKNEPEQKQPVSHEAAP
jgi:hypothetical protein